VAREGLFMTSLLSSTKNTRPLRIGSFRYIRSDAICKLSTNDLTWLIENNITTIVDLRTADEVSQRPCCLKDHTDFLYINIPISGGNTVPKSSEFVPASYFKMVDAAMWKVISIIENTKTNVLYFCHAGKDRTGIVSALLLLRQNATHEEIITDYLCSADYLKEQLEEYCRKNPSIDIDTITPKAIYMEQFLREVVVE